RRFVDLGDSIGPLVLLSAVGTDSAAGLRAASAVVVAAMAIPVAFCIKSRRSTPYGFMKSLSFRRSVPPLLIYSRASHASRTGLESLGLRFGPIHGADAELNYRGNRYSGSR